MKMLRYIFLSSKQHGKVFFCNFMLLARDSCIVWAEIKTTQKYEEFMEKCIFYVVDVFLNLHFQSLYLKSWNVVVEVDERKKDEKKGEYIPECTLYYSLRNKLYNFKGFCESLNSHNLVFAFCYVQFSLQNNPDLT